MYTLTHNGNALFDPRLDGYPIQKPKMVQEANRIGSVTFTIFPGHPEYNQIDLLTSVVSVYRDGTLVMQARPVYRKRKMRGGIEYKCEELLARLNDFCCRPFSRTESISNFIDYVLASYNARVASSEQITKGNVYVTGDTMEYTQNQCYGHFDTLVSMLVENHGGYLQARYTTNGIYLDYLREQDLPLSGQTIQFGKNLADLFLETDAAEAFSVLVPQGATTQSQVNGTTVVRYVDISSVNSGMDYLESSTGIALFGRREAVEYWNDISDPAELKAKAQAFLDENAVKFAESVELSAADLHNMDVSIPAFQFLHRVKAESAFHDLSHIYPIEKLEIPIGDPEDADISLGKPLEPLSERIANEERQAKGSYDEFRFIVEGSGLYINKNGVWAFSQDTSTGLGSQFQIINTGISSKVSAGDIASTINQTAQSVLIQASKIDLDGYVTANQLSAEIGSFYNASTGTLSASWITSQGGQIGDLTVSGTLNVGVGNTASWQSTTIGGVTLHYIGSTPT